MVVSRGNPAARLMLIGEGPGAQEDSTGLPFVGRSGQLLDQLLAAAGIDSNRDAYVANVVKCRPPGNRKPTAAEMAACRPWLNHQIALVNPAVILLVGATALEGVLGIRGGITNLRGQWQRGSGAGLEGRWPVFINEAAYGEKHIALGLTRRERWACSPGWAEALCACLQRRGPL